MDEKLSSEIRYNAWHHWCDYFEHTGEWGGYDCEISGYKQFEKLIGANIFKVGGSLTDEQARRVRLLAGPHWFTIIAAWRANGTEAL